MNGTFVTLIQIRKASVQAYRHSSQLSHNTYVQTFWNKLYVRTSTVQDPNYHQKDWNSEWKICDLNSESYRFCTGYSHGSKLSQNTYVQTISNWLYVLTSTVHYANGTQLDQISGWDFVISIQIRTVDVQAYSHGSELSHNTYVKTFWNWLYVHT